MSDTNEFLFTAKSSPTRTLDDARRRETPVAATGIGSIVTQLAALYNNMLGTEAQGDLRLSERAGDDARAWSAARSRAAAPAIRRCSPIRTPPAILAKLQFPDPDRHRARSADYESVPLLRELRRHGRAAQIFDFISQALVDIARPIVTNRACRRSASRRCAAPSRRRSPIPRSSRKPSSRASRSVPKSGAELEKMVADMLDTPPAVLDRVRQSIQGKAAESAKGVPEGAKSD